LQRAAFAIKSGDKRQLLGISRKRDVSAYEPISNQRRVEGIAMTAYMVVFVYADESDWVADYVANVPGILRKFGGEYLAVSDTVTQFEGEKRTPDQVALFTFPSVEQMQAFISCEEYAPYKDARLAQSSATIVGFETRS
jgi:uncharacterized protein (DUF1330 family)